MQRNLFTFTHLFIYRTCKRKTNYLESFISLLTAQISTSIRTTLTKEFKHINSSWLQGLHKQPRHFTANRCIPTTHYFYISTLCQSPEPACTHLLQAKWFKWSIVSKSVCTVWTPRVRYKVKFKLHFTLCSFFTQHCKLYIFLCIMFMGKQGRKHTALPYTINKPVNSISD